VQHINCRGRLKKRVRRADRCTLRIESYLRSARGVNFDGESRPNILNGNMT
jgi:hypothetical protein